ncbi:MAG: acetate uptake transporter [Candidatus Methanomethylicaceae archaeon]
MSQKQASPAPLGLAAFAMTTTALSLFVLGVLPAEGVGIVIPLAIAYGGIIQILVGYLEWKTGNTFGLVAFTSYGAFWLYYAMLNLFAGWGFVNLQPAAAGAVLILWGLFTFYLWIASLKTNLTTCLVFFFLWLAFVVLGVGDITGSRFVVMGGGIIALITAAAAWYNSLAIVINETYGRVVVPLGKSPK